VFLPLLIFFILIRIKYNNSAFIKSLHTKMIKSPLTFSLVLDCPS
jgi:hypothetical protein